MPDHSAASITFVNLSLDPREVEKLTRGLLVARRHAQRYAKYHERTAEDVDFYTELLHALGYVETDQLAEIGLSNAALNELAGLEEDAQS